MPNNGDEFSAIYRGGGHFKSGSERDLSLASRLAFWTQDEAQIERIMRGSGCAREKWDKHRTYLRDTIVKALDGLTETYTPPEERARACRFLCRSSAGGTRRRGRARLLQRPQRAASPPRRLQLTDLGNSERFVDAHSRTRALVPCAQIVSRLGRQTLRVGRPRRGGQGWRTRP